MGGYAIIDFRSNEAAVCASEILDGFAGLSAEGLACCWNEPHQGLEVQIHRYRNSPVMHESVPREYQPMLLRHGARIPFPRPTVSLKAPRLRPKFGIVA